MSSKSPRSKSSQEGSKAATSESSTKKQKITHKKLDKDDFDQNMKFMLKVINNNISTLRDTLIEVGYDWRDDIISVEKSELMPSCLQKMQANNILTLPVVTRQNKYVGFVDAVQIVYMIGSTFPNSDFKTYKEFHAIHASKKALENCTVGHMITASSSTGAQKYFTQTNNSFSVFHLLEMFAKGTRKIVVFDENSKIQFIATPSMAIEYIHANKELLDVETRNLKVDNFVTKSEPVHTVNMNDRALSAFATMNEKQVSFLAVVDEAGKMVDIISIKDLHGLKILDTDHVWRLYGTVKEFKDLVHKEIGHKEVTGQMEYHIHVIKKTDTLEHCLEEMKSKKVMQLYILDRSKKPVRCVTNEEVLRNIFN